MILQRKDGNAICFIFVEIFTCWQFDADIYMYISSIDRSFCLVLHCLKRLYLYGFKRLRSLSFLTNSSFTYIYFFFFSYNRNTLFEKDLDRKLCVKNQTNYDLEEITSSMDDFN